MTNKTETTTEIIYEGDLILESDFKTEKSLIVHGNIKGKAGKRYDINAVNINAWNINAVNIDARDINAWDINAVNINAWNINAGDINAWNIICEKRIKKLEKAKTISRVFIQNKSQLEIKEQLK